MSYGVLFNSSADGSVILSAEQQLAVFLGKGGLKTQYSTDYQGYWTYWTTDLYCPVVTREDTGTYSEIDMSKPDVGFYALPTSSSNRFYIDETDAEYLDGNNKLHFMHIFYALTNVMPEVYWFRGEVFATAGSENYGLRLFDASSNLIFDNGQKFLYVRQFVSINIADGGYSDVIDSRITKPCILLRPPWVQIVYPSIHNASYADMYVLGAYFNTSDRRIYLSKMVRVLSGYTSSDLRHTGTLVLPIIDGALYD